MSNKSIVYLEGDESWLFDGSTLTPCGLDAIKKHPSGISVSLSSLQIGNFKFPASLSATEKHIQTEIKMHEEAGLSSDKNYEMASYSHHLEFENSTLIEAFACDVEVIKEQFGDIAKKAKVIDWIIPSFVAYESYYSCHPNDGSTDLFYYLSDTESYAVLIQNGKYIANRRTASIEQLAKETGIDEVRCKRLLSEYGLNPEKYPEEDRVFFDKLESLFSKQVEKIVHTVNHKRGIFGIDGIDNIYIDFAGKNLDGLERIFAAFGMNDIPVNAFVCEDENAKDSHRYLKAMYIYLCANEKLENSLNLTMYERQTPLHKRPAGYLLGIGLVSFTIGLFLPIYYMFLNSALDDEINILNSKLSSLQIKQKVLNEELKVLRTNRKADTAKLNAVKEVNIVYNITLDTLPKLMNSKVVRQRMMYDSLDMLSKYKLSAVSLEQNATNEINVHVICAYSKRDNIAKFMKKWINSGYSSARTDEIYLDENIYESKIRVAR